MALRGGFEPPTPWFVAKYSIQETQLSVNIYNDKSDKTH